MKTFTPSVSKAQTKVCELSQSDANRSFTAQWRLHSLTHFYSFLRFLSVYQTMNVWHLLVTCGVFASSFFVLLHVDIFVFSFLSNHQNTFVTNQAFAQGAGQTCRGRFTRILIRQQQILGMWFWLRTVMEYGDGERLPWIQGDRGRRSEERRIERNSATDGEEDVGRIRSR